MTSPGLWTTRAGPLHLHEVDEFTAFHVMIERGLSARQFGRVKGKPEPPTDAENARLAELTVEIDRLKQATYGLADDRTRPGSRSSRPTPTPLHDEMHSHESYNAVLMACSGPGLGGRHRIPEPSGRVPG